MEERFFIKELSRRSGVKPGMIRYFEKQGLLTPPIRTPSGYRVFGPHHVKELRFLQKMYDLGFYAQHIRRLKEIKSSDLPRSKKIEALTEALREHLRYVKEKIRYFEDMKRKIEEVAPTFVEEVLEDC